MLKGKRIILIIVFFAVAAIIVIAWAGTINLPRTGQTISYATGDDGALQRGVSWPSPRFTVSGDCVIDNLTGLEWVKSPDSTTRTWADALTYANDLALCGFDDWRLPNVNELESLINAGEENIAIWLNGQGFTNVQSFHYWSSTTFANTPDNAWVVSMYNGVVFSNNKTNANANVWPVKD
ncbi:MAG: DUF1566 domain-containing protein [Nitrospira sp.]|nr:DUF1566 domain-containing protein [Nitrospira sp.]